MIRISANIFMSDKSNYPKRENYVEDKYVYKNLTNYGGMNL